MLEDWLSELGAEITDSIHILGPGDGLEGFARFGPLLPSEFSGDRAPVPALQLRYGWEEIHIGWGPYFDRWANSRDWYADVPDSKEDLAWILSEAIRLGELGDRGELHDFQPVKLARPPAIKQVTP